jgi:AraC-like DNA-binding protein
MNSFSEIIAQKKLIEDALVSFYSSINSQIQFYPKDIQKMLKYIHDHLFENTLTVEKVKKECGFTNNNIVTRFRHIVEQTPRKYIIKRRLEAVVEILNKSNINNFILAESIGYTEEAFSRIFRKVYGCTPIQFKEIVKIKHENIQLRDLVKRKYQERRSNHYEKS